MNSHRRARKMVKPLYGPGDCPIHVSTMDKGGLPRVSVNSWVRSTGMAQVGPLWRWSLELQNTRHKMLTYWQFYPCWLHRTMGRGIGMKKAFPKFPRGMCQGRSGGHAYSLLECLSWRQSLSRFLESIKCYSIIHKNTYFIILKLTYFSSKHGIKRYKGKPERAGIYSSYI